MKVGIYGKDFNPEFNPYIIEFINKIQQNNISIIIFEPFYKFIIKNVDFDFSPNGFFNTYKDIPKDIDLCFSVGGDGTFLETASFIRNQNIPIVGINSGRLGFLANIAKENISLAINSIIANDYQIEERTLLQLDTKQKLFNGYNYALNEFTVHKRDSSSMIMIKAYLNNDYLNTYWADGLVVATATGSTAYSLSAGGPILTPNSENFVITPIAPHSLTVRPLIIPNDYELKLTVTGRNINCLVSLDHRHISVDEEIELIIKRSDYKIKTIKFSSDNFFVTLRSKLMWGLDRRN